MRLRCIWAALMLLLVVVSTADAKIIKPQRSTTGGGLGGSVVKGIAEGLAGEAVASAAEYAAKYAAESAREAANAAKAEADADQAAANSAKNESDSCYAAGNSTSQSYSNCNGGLSVEDACNSSVQAIYAGSTGVYSRFYATDPYGNSMLVCSSVRNGSIDHVNATIIYCGSTATVDKCASKKKSSDDATEKAAASKDKYESLDRLADALEDAYNAMKKDRTEPTDCVQNDPREFCNKYKKPPQPDPEQPCDYAPVGVPCSPVPDNNPDNPPPDNSPADCIEGDPRPECFKEYKKPPPPDPNFPDPPAGSGDGSCQLCCNGAETVAQLDGMRAELARDRALSKEAASKMKPFKNGNPKGFTNGYEDGLKASKITLCGGDDCAKTFCEKNPTDKTNCAHKEGMIFHEFQDYGNIQNGSCTCEKIVFDFTELHLGHHEVTIHCEIMEFIKPKLAIVMYLSIAITALLIILSA